PPTPTQGRSATASAGQAPAHGTSHGAWMQQPCGAFFSDSTAQGTSWRAVPYRCAKTIHRSIAKCAHRASAEVETKVRELRREHPWWGSGRVAQELACPAAEGDTPPDKSTVYRNPAPPLNPWVRRFLVVLVCR